MLTTIPMDTVIRGGGEATTGQKHIKANPSISIHIELIGILSESNKPINDVTGYEALVRLLAIQVHLLTNAYA